MTDLVGQEIAHYRLDSLIGDGGMGSVYKAYDQNLERYVAIKVTHDHFTRLPEFRGRLAQEAKTAAQLDHPSIVRIFDFGEYDGGLYIAMEFIGGGSLRSHLARLQGKNKFLPIKQSFQIGIQIADALDYAHSQGVIHRDVKPGNIILKQTNRPDETNKHPFRAVLTDFGLVKLLGGDSMTQSGTTLGTPTYMSPEQCEGQTIDGRSDLYSLGVVLYELLTNRLPFAFNTLSEAVRVHMRGEMPTPPSELRSRLPQAVDMLVMRCLAKKPEDRYRSGQEMADAFENAIFSLTSSPTQEVKKVEAAEKADRPKEYTRGKYRVRISTPGRKSSSAALVKDIVTIGRNADNDIVLPAERVSRYHARLEMIDKVWHVLDMGGINGTWLNEQRLSSGVSKVIAPGDTLEIGPYKLEMEVLPAEEVTPDLALTTSGPVTESETIATSTSEISEAATDEHDSRPLSIYMARDNVTVEPGKITEVNVEVFNRGDVTDRVSLRVLGLPDDWLELPDTFMRVGSRQSVTVPFQVRPPRMTDTPAGRQRMRIEVISQQYANIDLAINATLTLGTFEAFEIAMEPKKVSLPALVRVTIRNTGNTDAEFAVLGNDPAGQINFRGERDQIRLGPRQTAAVDLELDPKERRWFGKSGDFPFLIEVKTNSGTHQSTRGKATISALLPIGVLYGFLFISIFLCVVAGLLLIFQADLFGSRGTPTVTPIGGIAGTSTAASSGSATAAFVATSEAATAAAATAEIIGDRDNDGLSDSQENIIGTDPDNPDSDSDGLLDGEEVLTWGTQPLIRDTDTDVLLDGDEVHSYGTDPTSTDTDGEGVPDGVEVAMGSDPLDPFDPPPTLEPATFTPTPSNTPVLPTDTPTPSATPSASPTTTPSPTPTRTPTVVPTETATPTASPTEPPTATFTPTATNTPVPAADCHNDAPELDGSLLVAEWGSDPAFSFSPENDNDRVVNGWLQWVEDQFYLAFEIEDPTNNQAIDSLRVYFDVNNNGGDPDVADRFFQVVREGTRTSRSGIGTANDGLDWNSGYSSVDWDAAVGEKGSTGWLIEFHIDTPSEMPDLLAGDPFGMMVLVQFTGKLGIWPDGAISNVAESWQSIDSAACQ